MTEAAFKACYSEWRMIKTRATVQLVFEIPIEQADAAYQALGGMPIAAKEVWCGIARLKDKVSHSASPGTSEERPGPATSFPSVPAKPVRADKPRRQFGEIAPAQQAGIFCNEVAFHKFLQEEFKAEWMRCDDYNDQRRAANVVREICEVNSRSEITPQNTLWSALVLKYRLWQREPEFIGAA